MANTLKIKRGTAATIPQGQLAEPLFTTDTYDLYIGKGAGGNQRIQNYIASGTSSQFLKGDGSLDSTTYQATSEKGQNNGYASLDAGGKIPAAQLPSSVIEYKGTWNASTNTPTLADGTGDAGDVYIVSVGGTQNLGSGSITFDAGDWVMYNGAIWQKSTGSNAVASVNGQTGIVSIGVNDLDDTTITSPSNGQLLQYSTGTNKWINWTPNYVPYTGATADVDLGFNNFDANQINGFQILAKLNGTGSSPLILKTGTSGYSYGSDAISLISSPTSANTLTIISDVSSVNKIAQFGLGSLTATRTYTLPDATGTLALTSNIPANIITGTGTNNEIAYFNTTGSTIASLSTATYPSLTELSYVKGVTSAIQTQLNAKEPTLTKGNLTETTSSVLTITGGTGAVIGSGTTIAVASAGAAQAGVVTTGTQTFAGAKTFSSNVTSTAFIPTGSTVPANGMYLPSANTLGLSANSTKVIEISDSGRVSIGATSPTTDALTVFGAITTTNGGAITAAGTISSGSTISSGLNIIAVNTISGSALIPTGTTAPTVGMYLVSGTSTLNGVLGFSTNATKRLEINNSTGDATFTNNISAANLSGTNTGDQTLAGLGGVPTSRTITINGTSFDLSANRTYTVGTIGGSGTSGYLPKFTAATTIGNSLVYDNGSRVMINTTTDNTVEMLQVNGGIRGTSLRVASNFSSGTAVNVLGQIYVDNRSSQGGNRIFLTPNTTSTTPYVHFYEPFTAFNTNGGISIGTSNAITTTPTDSIMHWDANNIRVGINTTAPDLALTVNGAINMRNSTRAGAFEIDASGNLWIGTATTAGNIYLETGHSTTGLPSTGTARLTLNQSGATFSSSVTVTSDLTVDTNTLYVDSTNNRVGIGTTTFLDTTYKLSIKQGTNRNIAIAEQSSELSIEAYNDAGSANVPLRLYASEFNMLGGSVGIGTASPAALDSGGINLQIKDRSSLFQLGAVNSTYLGNNVYYDGTWKRIVSGFGSMIRLLNDNNGISFYTFGTAAANTSITFTEAMHIKNDGNVGIGTTSPNRLLDVSTGSDTYVRVTGNRGNADGVHIGNIEFYNSFSSILAGEVRGITGTGGTQSNSGQLAFYTNNAGTYAERMRITSGGRVGINNSNPGDQFVVNGAANVWSTRLNGSSTSGQSYGMYIAAGTTTGDTAILIRNQAETQDYLNIRGGDGFTRMYGVYNNTSANAANVVTTSDNGVQRSTASSLRYKQNIQDWSGNGLETILSLKPKTFTYKPEHYKNPNLVMLGLIAEEVAEVSPYLAEYQNEDRTGLVENVRYANIVVPLIKAIQEQQAQIEELKSKLN